MNRQVALRENATAATNQCILCDMDRVSSPAMRDQRVIVLLSEEEKAVLARRAARKGLTLSAYMRSLFLADGGLQEASANQTVQAS